MRHHNSNRKFGRVKNQRNALIKHLAESLVQYERIETTEAKAKELRSFIEKLVTRARIRDLSSERILVSRLGSKTAAKKLINDIAPKYIKREGGYTRVIKLPRRHGDSAKMALIEFV